MKRSIATGVACAVACALAFPPFAIGQVPAPAAGALAPSAPGGQIFSQARLDQMLAPIALYPDALLSQILIASTYPVEVVEADRWVGQHRGLQTAALQDALKPQPWDESVKTLCAFAAVLDRMSQDLGWTEQLGQAFTAQQQQVMATIQSLRTKARAAGNLKSNAQQTVSMNGDYISVAPANPQVIYVPTYAPAVAYGRWWWPDYPPYFPVYWGAGLGFVGGFFWGAGITIGTGWLWGGFDWSHNVVHSWDYFHGRQLAADRWRHDMTHRAGDPFRGPEMRQDFAHEQRAAPFAREGMRGFEEHGERPAAREFEREGGFDRGVGGGHGGGGHGR